MWKTMLNNLEWKQLGALASPAALEVFSARELYSGLRSMRWSPDEPRFANLVLRRARSLRRLPLAVRLTDDVDPVGDRLALSVEGDAARLVTLYFHQLFSAEPTLLDMRATAFEHGAPALLWTPVPWVHTWSDDFLPPLRDLYMGYYDGDEQAFRHGLSGLGLSVAGDLLRRHFGEEPESQRFRMADFIATFQEVFRRCRDAGVRLHPDFVPLGIYLAGLYDCLERVDVRVDVRACFEHATSRVTRVMDVPMPALAANG